MIIICLYLRSGAAWLFERGIYPIFKTELQIYWLWMLLNVNLPLESAGMG